MKKLFTLCAFALTGTVSAYNVDSHALEEDVCGGIYNYAANEVSQTLTAAQFASYVHEKTCFVPPASDSDYYNTLFRKVSNLDADIDSSTHLTWCNSLSSNIQNLGYDTEVVSDIETKATTSCRSYNRVPSNYLNITHDSTSNDGFIINVTNATESTNITIDNFNITTLVDRPNGSPSMKCNLSANGEIINDINQETSVTLRGKRQARITCNRTNVLDSDYNEFKSAGDISFDYSGPESGTHNYGFHRKTDFDLSDQSARAIWEKLNEVDRRLDQVDKSVLTGNIAHGEIIPLPEHYSEEQCTWSVSNSTNYHGSRPNWFAGSIANYDKDREVTCGFYDDSRFHVRGECSYTVSCSK